MKLRSAVLAVVLGSIAAPALAQPVWMEGPGYRAGPPPRMLMRIVREEGFRPVGPPVRRGPYFVVRAIDPYGQLKTVVLDAERGVIVRVHAPGPRAMAWRGPPFANEYVVRPPRPIPNVGRPALAAPPPDAPYFEDEERADRPPPLPPLRSRRALGDSDPDFAPEAMAPGPEHGRPSRAPMRPEDQTGSIPMPSEGAGLPPPRGERNAVRTPARPARPTTETEKRGNGGAAQTAKAAPATAPLPRERPANSEPAGSGAEQGNAAAKPAAPARVILPGGPTPKHERTADKASGKTAAPAKAPEDKPAQAGSGAAPSGAATPAIPPAQTLE